MVWQAPYTDWNYATKGLLSLYTNCTAKENLAAQKKIDLQQLLKQQTTMRHHQAWTS
jgi:hypothetical protein